MSRVLADADELIAAGRALDAIDLLTDANRHRPDDALERRLVDARHRSFDELDRRPGRSAWPPPAGTCRDGEVSLPEIGPNDLDDSSIAHGVVGHGLLCVRGLVDEQIAGDLREVIERSFDARERLRARGGDGDRWFRPFSPGRSKSEGFGQRAFVRTVDSPRALYEVAEAFEASGLTRAATGYLGERPAMVANKWVLRRIPADTIGNDFHQDGAFLGEGIRALNCRVVRLLAVRRRRSRRPGISNVVPRRFDDILPTGEDGAIFPWSVSEATARRAASDAGILRPAFRPGDALLFDERLLHRTGVRAGMTRDRFAIESWFFAPSTYPDKHVPVVL
ncbi:MAG: hypothetical protein U5R31_05370 [Acidimicrobiia bacterium]|nr:hypothetical protein [Acidimicrobiia bacterium]